MKIFEFFKNFVSGLTKQRSSAKMTEHIQKQLHPMSNMNTLENSLRKTHDWAENRIKLLQYATKTARGSHAKNNMSANAKAVYEEFEDWFNPDIEEHDIISINSDSLQNYFD
jgi:translation initiation factor 2B subunit (eIF-2B alpha/beta/delta family)